MRDLFALERGAAPTSGERMPPERESSAGRERTLGSAGHPAAYHTQARAVEAVEARGVPLGLHSDLAMTPVTRSLEPRSVLLLHTDGIYAARRPSGAHHGDHGFLHLVGQPQPHTRGPEELVTAVLKETVAYPSDEEVTLCAIGYPEACVAADGPPLHCRQLVGGWPGTSRRFKCE